MPMQTFYGGELGKQYVDLGGGLRVPFAFRAAVIDEFPYTLDLHIALENGRFICYQLDLHRAEGGPPVTTEGLREIPITSLVRRAVEAVANREAPHVLGGTVPRPVSTPERLSGGPDEAALHAVADMYRLSYVLGMPPTKAVTERLGLPRSTASRWIALARKQGLLGPAMPGKAGG